METSLKRRLAHTDDMTREACAIRLRAARMVTGMAQNAMATAAGFRPTALQNMEAGRNFPNDAVMRFLFREHRIDFNFLMNGTYAQLPGDVQDRLFPALEAANNEWDQRSNLDRPRRGRPSKQLQT